jgi:hypothetical protein
MSKLIVGSIEGLTSNGNIVSVPTGHRLKAPGGVVNVYTVRSSDTYTNSSTSYVDMPNMSITLTPVSSTSKFLILVTTSRASTRIANLDYAAILKVVRNGSDNVAINGTKVGSRDNAAMVFAGLSFNADHNPGGWAASAIDSPSASEQLTYKIQTRVQTASYPLTLNGSNNGGSSGETYHAAGQTSMTILEIGA